MNRYETKVDAICISKYHRVARVPPRASAPSAYGIVAAKPTCPRAGKAGASCCEYLDTWKANA
eukprot:scaffold14410_cov38-Prasinocladus_malaysianus.AAC.1